MINAQALVTSAARPTRRATLPLADARWIYGFVGAQMACQLALVLLDVSGFRTLFRVVAFGLSLAFLALIPGRPLRHPALPAVAVILVLYAVQLFNPTTNTLLAGLAQSGLTLAILAPLAWATRIRVDGGILRRTLLMFWVFHAASAAVGVLQVYFPGRFQPDVSTVIMEKGEGYVSSLEIELESGEHVFRPMGLTDVPGGAASSGFYAVLLGMAFFLGAKVRAHRMLYGASMALGMAAIYLSQVRVMLVLLVICIAGAAAVLFLRGQLNRFTSLAGAMVGVAVLGLWISFGAARTAVTSRLDTLISDRPSDVYYQNRGHFLETTISEFIPQFPFGAGLGRWGMMNSYFGTSNDLTSSVLWAEIQWTGWIFDGGVPLALAYLIAVALTLLVGLRLALRRGPASDELWLWATILTGYNLGVVALTFSYPIFVSQSGMEFWLLNALLFAAAHHRTKAAPQGSLALPGRPTA